MSSEAFCTGVTLSLQQLLQNAVFQWKIEALFFHAKLFNLLCVGLLELFMRGNSFYVFIKTCSLIICYCCMLFIIVLCMSLLKVQPMKFACCINKSALLCSFCILTDNLMIVKHHMWLCIQKEDVNLPIILIFYCQGYIWQSWPTMFFLFFQCFFFYYYFFFLQHWVYGCCTQPGLHSNSPMEQSGPIQLGSQLHRPVSGIKAPWPWHWSGHWALGSSQWSPPQPGLQWHSPFTQMPLLEHVGSRQSTALNKRCIVWKDNPF